MNNFYNFLKVGALLGVFLIGVSLFYYLVIYTPAQNKDRVARQLEENEMRLTDTDRKNVLATKEKCRSVGEKFYKTYKEDKTDALTNESLDFDEPDYAYNSDLNTCLIALSYGIFGENNDGKSSVLFVDKVFDTLTNTELAGLICSAPDDICTEVEKNEYRYKEEDLMVSD